MHHMLEFLNQFGLAKWQDSIVSAAAFEKDDHDHIDVPLQMTLFWGIRI